MHKDEPWYKCSDPCSGVKSFYTKLYQQQDWRRRDNAQLEQLYENRFRWNGKGMTPNPAPTYNVCKSASDSLLSHIVRNRIRPRLESTAGNFTLYRKAKMLQKWLDYMFRKNGTREEAKRVAQDMIVYGTGVMKVFHAGTEVFTERVHPGEIYVDEAESTYGAPAQLLQVKPIPDSALKLRFNKFKPELGTGSDAAGYMSSEMRGTTVASATGMSRVYEAWKAGPGGRHVICTDNQVLLDEPYEYPDFPFAFLRIQPRPSSFWGIGIVQDLYGLQIQMNRLMAMQDRALHLASSPKIFALKGSVQKGAKFTNEPGEIIYYTGTPPTVYAGQPVSQDIWRQIDSIYSRAHELVGLNVAALQGGIPSGLETGQAVREYADVNNARMASALQSWESLHLRIGELLIRCGKEAYEEDPSFSVVAAADKYTIQSVPWEDLDLAHDQYTMSVEPASNLPMLPSGRAAQLDQWLAMGTIDRSTYFRLMDFPDLEDETSLATSAEHLADFHIEQMLDENKQPSPEPYMDLRYLMNRVQAAYNRASTWKDMPDYKLQALRNYMTACQALLKMEEQAAAVLAAASNAPAGAPPQGPSSPPGMPGMGMPQ